jgi:hypothetical protein
MKKLLIAALLSFATPASAEVPVACPTDSTQRSCQDWSAYRDTGPTTLAFWKYGCTDAGTVTINLSLTTDRAWSTPQQAFRDCTRLDGSVCREIMNSQRLSCDN